MGRSYVCASVQDPELLRFIDIECYCWSTVLADFTPMINSGMVFCDRHFGGINYPRVHLVLVTVKLGSKFSVELFNRPLA